MLMIDQLMEGWNTTSAHLVTVSVAEWMVVVASVIISIIMRTMISSVSVTEKVFYIYIYIYIYVCFVVILFVKNEMKLMA